MHWQIRNKRALATLIAVAATAGGASGQVQHQHHPPQDAGEYARILEDPSRDEWQKPHEVVMALALKSTDAIADIGAGTGYFARRFARHAGKVYAVDLDAKLLEIAAKNAPPNLITVLAAPDDPKLKDASVDMIFFCDVLHHIEGRPAYYEKLKRALKPLPVGPPPEMKLSPEQVEAEMAAAGFRKTRSFDFLPHQYFLEFEVRRTR